MKPDWIEKAMIFTMLALAFTMIALVVAGVLSSCVDQPDMSRREAIEITNLTKELTKNEHP